MAAKKAKKLKWLGELGNDIAENIPSSLLLIDRRLKVVYANRNFLEKARRSAQSTIGRKISEVFPSVLVDYLSLDHQLKKAFSPSTGSGQGNGQGVQSGRLNYRTPGLSQRTYFYRLVPLRRSGGEVKNVMLLLDDITEREELAKEVQRIERQLASVVESANDLIISTDPSGSIVTWNPAAERISGFSSAEVIGQELTRFFPDEQQLSLRTLLRRLTRGKPVDSAELTLVTRDGKEIPIYWTFSTMKDDQGRVSGIVAVGRDLTERRKFEEQLIEQAKMASLGVMAGGIAHELRNPLGISSAAAQLLLDGKSSEKMRRQCARKIYEGIHRASQIIENLLKFARPPKEKMAKVDVNEALNEALSLLPAQTKPQQVKIRLKLDPSIPPVMANKELLQQVFINMILNAFSAMPSGGQLTIQTGWTKRPRNSSELHIRFKDTGFGIPRQNLSRIFDPFFTTMPAGKGTGLGLSICYSIVRQHGGAIEVESEVGKGTTFTIRLPFERQPKGNRHEEDALRTGIEGKAVHPHSG